MESRNGNGTLLRLGAGFVLAMGVVLVGLRVIAGRQAGEAPLPMLASAGAFLMLAVGLSLALLALAGLLDRRHDTAAASPDLSGVSDALAEIRDEVNLLRSNVAAEQARREDEEETRRESLMQTTVEPQSLQRVLQLLEEVREVALLNDAQKQERLEHQRQHRKRARLRAAQEAIRLTDWSRAQHLLDETRVHHAADPDLHQVESELRIARSNAEAETLARVRTEVEDLMALSHWDEALQKARDFAEGFPDSHDGQALLARVNRERGLYRDNTAERMYKDIREHLEHRQWRRALNEAERLTTQFADHKRAVRIREQIDVIRENAEIQERQEQEKRIEELLRARRLNEAIELAEDLIERFPDSPQARSLQEILPKLRERAIKEEITS